MASTSVHFPKGLIEALDRLAAESGVSRNRLVVEACRGLVERRARAWPAGWFEDGHLSAEDLAELRGSADSFLADVLAARRTRTGGPF